MQLSCGLQLQKGDFRLNVQLSASGSRFGLFGPSGAGKTTLIRVLAGLELAAGRISVDDEIWLDTSRGVNKPAHERRVGWVPQENSLFPHLDVKQNLLFSKYAQSSLLDTVVQTLELDTLCARKVSQLSGGEAKRVALGRALLTHPRMLLFDEPLAGLDWRMKHHVLGFLLKAQSRFAAPFIFVSHDPAEIGLFCDEVWFLREGQLEAQGATSDVFLRPESDAAALLAGIENLWEGTVQAHTADTAAITIGDLALHADFDGPPGQPVKAVVAASEILLSRTAPAGTSARNLWPGRVARFESRVHGILVHLDCGFQSYGEAPGGDTVPLVALITPAAASELQLQVGDMVCAVFKSNAVRVFPL